jgi:hypothetical protein
MLAEGIVAVQRKSICSNTLLSLSRSSCSPQLPYWLKPCLRETLSFDGEQKADRATAELTQIEREWHQALEKNDIAALDRLLAPKWFITNGSGNIIGKSELLAALRAGEIKFVSTVPSDIQVHVYNQAAVVTKRSTDQTMYGSNTGGGRYQMTDMFVKLEGRWQCVATHASKDLKP